MSVWPHDLVELPALLRERGVVLGQRAHFCADTDSTQSEAKRAASAGAPHGSLWLADHQASGRGRQGRVWQSPAGENVLLSLLLRGSFVPARTPFAALCSGLAVRDAVSRALPAHAEVAIKWPNDVLVRRGGAWRKIAGVLVEAQSRGNHLETLIVGVGVNVHTREFPAELGATSVALEAAEAPERARVVADIMSFLDRHLEHVLARGLGLVHAELERYDALKGGRVRGDAGEGIALGVDLEGRLRVRTAEGEIQAWSFGEVHLEREVPR